MQYIGEIPCPACESVEPHYPNGDGTWTVLTENGGHECQG